VSIRRWRRRSTGTANGIASRGRVILNICSAEIKRYLLDLINGAGDEFSRSLFHASFGLLTTEEACEHYKLSLEDLLGGNAGSAYRGCSDYA
jgi:hypothetical protein